jgi:hypothetical protein
MAVLQTSYTDQVAPGYAGMVANAETSNRITRTIEDASGIAFGKAAFRGTGDHGCTATPTAGGFLGITIAHEALGLVAGQTADVFPQYGNVPILTQGVIWVTAGASVADGEQAYVTSAGAFTNVSTSNVILPGFFFDTTAASGALVKLAKR